MDNEISFENHHLGSPFLVYTNNQSGIYLGSTVDDLLSCQAQHIRSNTPIVVWIKDGKEVVNSSDYFITISDTNDFQSNLTIVDFISSDVGVYQCIFIDTNEDAEVVTTTPYRLDTGTLIIISITYIYIPITGYIPSIRYIISIMCHTTAQTIAKLMEATKNVL